MFNYWLWRSKIPPIPTALLTSHISMRGLSLLDLVAHAHTMFCKWLSTVLDPNMCFPSWQYAARIQQSKSLNLNNYKLNTTLFNYLSNNPSLYGPQTLSGFWRTVTACFCHSNLLVTQSVISTSKGSPKNYILLLKKICPLTINPLCQEYSSSQNLP